MKTVKFSREYLLDELEVIDSAIEDKVVGNTRWSVQHEIVFKVEDKFYRANYQVGATESQDESPWEYDDEVVCTEVHQVEQMRKVWVPR